MDLLIMTCKICDNQTTKIFSKTVLKKYPADYLKCAHCGFVQTSEPVWIEEAYNSAITSLDIGLLDRNIQLRDSLCAIIDACFKDAKIMLDYAGGYGVMVRLMRDKGYNFYRQDPYCQNLFAEHFDLKDISTTKFDILTAFEVFEHFVDPLKEIEKMFSFSDNIVFSTQLTPANNADIEKWWYISEETGQHVAFYSKQAMELIATKCNKKYYSNGSFLHLFTSLTLSQDQIDYAFHNIRYKNYLSGLLKKPLTFKIERKSLIDKDYNDIKALIKA